MVIVVYGFPSKFAALQFEWAWQNPHKSRHFKNLDLGFNGRQKERLLSEKLRALGLMFNLDQYSRWPLHIHFCNLNVYEMFKTFNDLPRHVRVSTGSLKTLPVEEDITETCLSIRDSGCCDICSSEIDIENLNDWVCCTFHSCPMMAHLICLSNDFIAQDNTGENNLIPIIGHCPSCGIELKWGDLIKALKSRTTNPNKEIAQKVDKIADISQSSESDSTDRDIPNPASKPKTRKEIKLLPSDTESSLDPDSDIEFENELKKTKIQALTGRLKTMTL
jgi:structure-specific endonuclease subunit SLX1